MTALREAMREVRIRKTGIVTWLDEDSRDEWIRIVPAGRWLLEGDRSPTRRGAAAGGEEGGPPFPLDGVKINGY